MKIDRVVLGKAVGIILLGWLALPIVYYILLKRKGVRKEENGKKEPGGTDDKGKGEGSV